jgi:dihydrofolate reductase
MRKLKLQVQMSVDGFIASPNGNTDWMIWNWGPNWTWDKELQEYFTNLTLSAEHILISRQMAEEGFNAHWQNKAKDNESSQSPMAKHITKTHKVVFSKTLNKNIPIPGGWDNIDLVNTDFINAINELKKISNKDIFVYGGSTFVSSLIKEKLIDEFYLFINPVVIGNGLPIFHSLNEKQDLKLLFSQAFNCGIILLVYKLIQ